ncbi:MAG: hypothetical protein ACXAC7_00390 [Candidatus Hodarchaeales archaeon]|jgi:hypothetical protein
MRFIRSRFIFAFFPVITFILVLVLHGFPAQADFFSLPRVQQYDYDFPVSETDVCDYYRPGNQHPAFMVLPSILFPGNSTTFYLELCVSEPFFINNVEIRIQESGENSWFYFAIINLFVETNLTGDDGVRKGESIWHGTYKFDCRPFKAEFKTDLMTEWAPVTVTSWRCNSDVSPNSAPNYADAVFLFFGGGLFLVLIVGSFAFLKTRRKIRSNPRFLFQESFIVFKNVNHFEIRKRIPAHIKKRYNFSDSPQGVQFFRKDGRDMTSEDHQELEEFFDELLE